MCVSGWFQHRDGSYDILHFCDGTKEKHVPRSRLRHQLGLVCVHMSRITWLHGGGVDTFDCVSMYVNVVFSSLEQR